MSFPGIIRRTIQESSKAWSEPLRAKPGAPKVLFAVPDDTGVGQLSCYCGSISKPNIDRLAENGLSLRMDAQ